LPSIIFIAMTTSIGMKLDQSTMFRVRSTLSH
jgi:hypothetical protein